MTQKRFLKEIYLLINQQDFCACKKKEFNESYLELKKTLKLYDLSKDIIKEINKKNRFLEEYKIMYEKQINALTDTINSLNSDGDYLKMIAKVYEINPIVLLKLIFNGIYYIKDNEIFYKRHVLVLPSGIIGTKPIYACKEITLESCYYGTDCEPLTEVKDGHYFDWKTFDHWSFNDYKKKWAFTKDELIPLLQQEVN